MNQLANLSFWRRTAVLVSFLLFTLAGPLTARATEVAIEGRVLTESGPLAGAEVSAHLSYADLQNNQKPAARAKTDQDGVYKLQIPPGSYYFTARGESGGRGYYAYHGSNPLKISKDNFWLGLPATPVDAPPVYVRDSTGVAGVVTYKGKPLDGAYVALYKSDSQTFKGLGVKTESVGSDGSFKLNVEPGAYVVTARKTSSGKSNRPLQQGDLYCYYSQNPVVVKADQKAQIELSCHPKDNRDTFAAAKKIKSGSLDSYSERVAASKFGVRGKVIDQSGLPVAGMNVLAYRLTAPVFMMYHVYHGSEFSSLTDEKGEFFIPLDADGDYGLVARDILGDGPHRGEMYGLYQENTRHAVAFKQGQLIDNVTIIAGKVMDSSDQASMAANPEVIIGTRDGSAVVLKDTVITRDTVWQGEIEIQGVISVKRGSTLIIRPGTVIRFKKIDRDHNGVGDGEILVEGRLIAKGTPDKKIVFTSAEAKPAANDWSYLQFLASNKGNQIEHCLFEYAFAGVMVHYADVKISDTLFRRNNRGLHYNTADLIVEHNNFVDNRIGIRFMRMEGNVQISNNHISRNDVGVLFVRQHVNAVNFEQLNRGQEIPRYKGNNIYGNRNYNFSLGEEQERDIKVPGNWWGSASRSEIAESLYDRNKNASVSEIFFEPFLDKPVAGAGVRGLDPEQDFVIKKSSEQGKIDLSQRGVLSGRFLQSDGAPLSGALLYLYDLKHGPLPSQNRYWRVPNHAKEIGGDGRFTLQAPPGEYAIGAIKRSDGLRIGPPGPTDKFMLSLDAAGQPKIYHLKPSTEMELGDISEVSGSTAPETRTEALTTIVGTITDEEGLPLEGIYAFAFPTPAAVGKPFFISEASDAKGHFRLNIDKGGSYYLKARGNLGGGPPQTGSVMDGDKDEPLIKASVSSGETSEPVILRTKVFHGRGRKK